VNCRVCHGPGSAAQDVEWPRVGGFPSGQEAHARLRARHLGWAIGKERTALKRATSRASGTKFGRPRKVDDTDHIATAKRMKADGHTGRDIAKYLGVSRATLYRYLTEAPQPDGARMAQPTVLSAPVGGCAEPVIIGVQNDRRHGIASAHFICPSKPSAVAIAR
jgi:hypothetical protein